MQAFARYLKIIARGPTLSRPLDADEAEAAFGMILDGEALPLQAGAFLLVLRQRGETAAELTGMIRAVRQRAYPMGLPGVDLDWPSYADAHRQLPYFLLAAQLVAEAGVGVLMHGVAGAGEAGTRHALAALGLPVAADAIEAQAHIAAHGFAYLPIESLCPPLAELLALKPFLGVRTAVNSVTRGLNPAQAPAQIQGVFHPPYVPLHVEAQKALGQPRALVFKGGGGEGQRNPDKPCRSVALVHGAVEELVWPQLNHDAPWPWRTETLAVERLAALWRGEWSEPAPVAAVTGTAAMALWLTGRAAHLAAADRLAEELWEHRTRCQPVSRAA